MVTDFLANLSMLSTTSFVVISGNMICYNMALLQYGGTNMICSLIFIANLSMLSTTSFVVFSGNMIYSNMALLQYGALIWYVHQLLANLLMLNTTIYYNMALIQYGGTNMICSLVISKSLDAKYNFLYSVVVILVTTLLLWSWTNYICDYCFLFFTSVLWIPLDDISSFSDFLILNNVF